MTGGEGSDNVVVVVVVLMVKDTVKLRSKFD